MNIGLLTYHKSINYGSVLQTWATQNLLEKQGYSVEVIDYEPKSYQSQYSPYLHGKGIKTFIKNVLRVPVVKYITGQRNKFGEFRNRYLHLGNYDSSNGYKQLERYDCIVCGSDQIWNVHASDCDDVYFLPDVNCKKIAFSVSINNTDYTESRCNEEMKQWILDYDFLSCREESGRSKISKFIGEEKEVVTFLDPTLMHKKEDYYPICSERIISEPYIFLYKVWAGKDSYKLVADLGKHLNMPVYVMFTAKNIISLCKIESSGIKVIKENTSPSDYLSLIRFADYIVTDSFHGTAFSIIFEKQFICVQEKNKYGSDRNDERLPNILKFVDLEDRYIALDKISDFPISKKIDYTIITPKRLMAAEDNILMLKKAIDS